MYLIGSILSTVGPAVTTIFVPFKSCSLKDLLHFSTIVSGDANLPFPISPHASLPLSGSTNL